MSGTSRGIHWSWSHTQKLFLPLPHLLAPGVEKHLFNLQSKSFFGAGNMSNLHDTMKNGKCSLNFIMLAGETLFESLEFLNL